MRAAHPEPFNTRIDQIRPKSATRDHRTAVLTAAHDGFEQDTAQQPGISLFRWQVHDRQDQRLPEPSIEHAVPVEMGGQRLIIPVEQDAEQPAIIPYPRAGHPSLGIEQPAGPASFIDLQHPAFLTVHIDKGISCRLRHMQPVRSTGPVEQPENIGIA